MELTDETHVVSPTAGLIPFPRAGSFDVGPPFSRTRGPFFFPPETPRPPLCGLGGVSSCHLGRPPGGLAHRDGYAAQIEGGLEPHLPAPQLHATAVGIAQPCSRATARNRHARANSCVGTGDVLRLPQIICPADHIGAGGSDRADAQSTDTERI